MLARARSSRGNLLLELLMLVVGINIALWFEGRFEDFQDAETERQYLAGLRDDLKVDLATLDQSIELNQAKMEALGGILPRLDSLMEASPEEQAETVFTPSSYHFFEPSDFTWVSMQESGDFRLLSDPEIKKDLLRLVRMLRTYAELRPLLDKLDADHAAAAATSGAADTPAAPDLD